MPRRWRLEAFTAVAAVAAVWAWASGNLLALLVAAPASCVGALLTGLRWGRPLLGSLVWHLRNRLIVVYLFISVIPILLMLALARYSVPYLAGQIAVHLVESELERRVATLSRGAQLIAGAPEGNRSRILDRIENVYQERFPGLEILIKDGPQGAAGEESGITVKEQLLFTWARARRPGAEVTLMAPVTRAWLAGLAPGLGEVSVIHFPAPGAVRRQLRTHEDSNGANGRGTLVPAAVNFFDLELLWASEIPVALWDAPGSAERALLGVHSRLSALLQILFSQHTQSRLPAALYSFAVAFGLVQIVSIYLGVTITRTITGAIQDLYDGTGRVMQGDFAHRIPVKGDDQIAALAGSFNRMTENVERLLAVAKENERLQAELEIARQVQAQLFPKVVPRLPGLDLQAVCNPARMVSGDYYDYQQLAGGKVAIALADVAGKGISAALLMASLQASLRIEMRDVDGEIRTAEVVSRINRQLYANTAPEKYATFWLASYDASTGEMVYTNAGHLPPILIRKGSASLLDVNGMVVGAFPQAAYDSSRVVLEPGDVLVAYTDGVTEPENEFGEQFGEERLTAALVGAAHLDAGTIIKTVTEAVLAFTGSGELQDDMTMIVARRV